MQSIDSRHLKPPSYPVLFVEDDLKLVEVLADALVADHVQLIHVPNADEAIRVLRTSKFELVLLDVGLPGKDGFTLLEDLRREKLAPNTPLIMLTACETQAAKVRGFELGVVDYITKPFDMAELRARVRAALRTQRLQEELREANRQLEAARMAAEAAGREKLAFLANMSHEIRTPMNGVIALTNLLLQTPLNDEQRDLGETIRTSGESLLTIINDILNFSKLQAGKVELESRPLDLRQCLEESLDLLAPKAAEKDLELVYDMSDELPTVVIGDVTRLKQVLVNLLGNAVKFTPAGEVFLQVKGKPIDQESREVEALAPRKTGTRWELFFSVTDTGIGIAPDRLNRLFRSFGQADSSITRQFGGTGLGLAISRSLVETMGGRMWVESAEGQGSTFLFVLPLAAAPDAGTSLLRRPHAQLAGRRVLVVEGNARLRSLLTGLLRKWGAVPEECSDTGEALRHVQDGQLFDLAIVDQRASDPGSKALAGALRALPLARPLPVMILSGRNARPDDEIEGGEVGITHLSKPIKPAHFQAALVQLVAGGKSAPRRAPAPKTTDASLAKRYPLQLLLAEDNVINQKVALRLLQQMGYRAEVVCNGAEAIRAIEQKPYDVVLMDVQMPQMDGLTASRKIRQLQQEPGAPAHLRRPLTIIAMTASAMQGDRERCLAAGMDDYIAKPVRPEALEAALERHGQLQAKNAGNAPAAARIANLPAPASIPATPEPPPQLEQMPPVDMERLTEFGGGTPEGVREIVDLYLTQTRTQLEQIKQALLAGDGEEVARLAHSGAGAGGACGMTTIVPMLRRLERAGLEGLMAEAKSLFESVEREFCRIGQFLEGQRTVAMATEPQASVL